MAPQFAWDRRRAASNEARHGVTFEEAASVFRDPLAFIFDDDRHSSQDYREVIIGHSDRRRLQVVSFSERNGAVCIISARKATKREQADYERNRDR